MLIASRLRRVKRDLPSGWMTKAASTRYRSAPAGAARLRENHLVRPVAAGAVGVPQGIGVVGVFQRTAEGFWVRAAQIRRNAGQADRRPVRAAEAAGRPASPQETPDIYIPAKWTPRRRQRRRGAGRSSTGRGRGDPGPRGEIVEILQRQTRQFVGTYFESQGAAYVQIDGTLFAQPIYVGDPGAKNARPDDKVVIEMVRFPSPVHDGEGVIVEVLGPQGRPGVDTLSIIREFDLPDEFADDALDEARQRGRAVRRIARTAGST